MLLMTLRVQANYPCCERARQLCPLLRLRLSPERPEHEPRVRIDSQRRVPVLPRHHAGYVRHDRLQPHQLGLTVDAAEVMVHPEDDTSGFDSDDSE